MSYETAWPEREPDEVPSDEELEVEGPNESAPGHNPEVEEEEQG
jgi:hypothetical protein